MSKNNKKNTKQYTLQGVIVRLGDKVYSERVKEYGVVKRIKNDGMLLHFDETDEFDFEYTYWDELSVKAL